MLLTKLNLCISNVAVAVLFFLSALCSGQTPPNQLPEQPSLSEDGKLEAAALLDQGYRPLFNGRNLEGWRNPYPFGEAKVVDGEIHLQANKKFFLVTKKEYTDFRLSVEIHLPEGKANSGVMFRCHVDPTQQKKVFGYQAECDGSQRRWSGGFYDESRRGWIWPSTKGRSEQQFLEHEAESKAAFATPRIANALNRKGWNRFVITCVKDVITIELNGVQTVRFRDAIDASGFIGIQHHGEKGQVYRFRNLFIKELPVVPAKTTVSMSHQNPVAIKRVDEKTTLIDFGKVAFGNLVMPVPKGRGTAKVHFGEKLKQGRIDTTPPGTVRYGFTEFRRGQQLGNWVVPAPQDLRNVQQAGLMNANPPAVLTPSQWGNIMPFRWVEIEGLDEDFPYELIRRRAAFSKTWNDDASSFECSNETLNRLWNLCKYSIKATTFAGVYVDGDRERIPYEADAYLNQLSHYTTDDNVTMAARTFDWLMENGTWPSEWAPHMILMAHAEWMYSGDVDWLKQRYESLKTKTLAWRTRENGLVYSAELDRRRHDIVDWPKGERDNFVFTEVNTVVNAFHLKALQQMAVMAEAVGKTQDAALFRARFELAKQAFQETLFNSTTGLYVDGAGTEHSSMHANFFPLAFGLVPQENEPKILDWLKSKPMDCSVYAAQYLLDGLFEKGAGRKAISLMIADGDRSWKHMLDSDATITWEAWDMKYKGNQDWNHAWGAAPANLLPRFVLGVQPSSPGWKQVLVRPHPSGLKFAKGKVPTTMGSVMVDWTDDEQFILSLTIPEAISARVDVPVKSENGEVLVDGKRVDAEKRSGRWILKSPLSGNVKIEVR